MASKFCTGNIFCDVDDEIREYCFILFVCFMLFICLILLFSLLGGIGSVHSPDGVLQKGNTLNFYLNALVPVNKRKKIYKKINKYKCRTNIHCNQYKGRKT